MAVALADVGDAPMSARRPGRRFVGWTLTACLVLALVTGCGLPHRKDLDDLSERAAGVAEADVVLASYGVARGAVDARLDAAALSDLETGSSLRLDQSAITIQRRLGALAVPLQLGTDTAVWSPRFDSYPLWFAALVPLPSQHQQMVAIFTRRSVTSPWLLAAAPRLAEDTRVPAPAVGDGDTAIRLVDLSSPRWSDGAAYRLQDGPQEIADHYAAVLTDPHAPYAADFVADSFLTQMRDIRAAQPRRKVAFTQHWKALPVQYVLRLANGGALMVVTLDRTDSFDVAKGSALRFDGSDASAYLSGPVRHRARLDYEHQVLMVVPPDGKPLVIGQYGGLVDAHGR